MYMDMEQWLKAVLSVDGGKIFRDIREDLFFQISSGENKNSLLEFFIIFQVF